MPADWELDGEVERINEENLSIDANLAAKLVVSGYTRDEAVAKIKSVNDYRENYRNDPGVHIEGDENQSSIWTIPECNYPDEVKNDFDKHQVNAIAKELLDKF